MSTSAPGSGATILRVDGITCLDCAAKFERNVASLPGVTEARLNATVGKLAVEGPVDLPAIQREGAVEGYTVKRLGEASSEADRVSRDWNKYRVLAALASVVVGYGASLLDGPEKLVIAAFVTAAGIGGWSNYRKAMRAAPRGDLNMSVLMSVAVIGALLIGEYEEAGIVALLFACSEMLEGWTMDRARRSIRELMDVAPKRARVERHGELAEVPVEDVQVGDIMHVRPGEKLAMDGLVVEGTSAINQATVTGESIPVEKTLGDDVFAGTLNVHGLLRIEVTRRVEDTTIARIIHMVEEAQARRAPSQAFVDRFAAIYTPIVIALAAGIAILPPLIAGLAWEPWIYRGLTLLVVSCPCALVVSTPVAIVSAISNAARRGVLIKGGVYLEQMGSISAVAFDKTGTLTRGLPVVTDVVTLGELDEAALLADAAAVERHSEHPLAGAVVRAAYRRNIETPESRAFEALFGTGAVATIEARRVRIGSLKLFPDRKEDLESRVSALEDEGKTVLIIGDESGPYGMIAVADEVRPSAVEVIERLRKAGVDHAAILTGDNERVAASVALKVGADRFEASLLPHDKVGAVGALLQEYGQVAMVGDGINDAPALATATVGIAMGGAGSDTALETADIALLSDDLYQLPFTVTLSRSALRIIRQNIAFALGIKLVAVLLVFPGWLTLWLAILADMGASVLVTLNGMRLLRVASDDAGRIRQKPAGGRFSAPVHGGWDAADKVLP